MGSKVLRAIDSLELCLLHAVSCGDGIECGNYQHLGDGALRFVCLSRTLPLRISIGAGRDFDTSSATRAESRRDPHSTSERDRTLHDWKSRLPAAFPVPCHLLVRASVLGETA